MSRNDFDWVRQAVCRRHDPSMWDADTRGPDQRHAIAICQACPVREPCLRTGQAIRASGVWGGIVLVDGNRSTHIRQSGLPPYTLTCECGWEKEYDEPTKTTDHRLQADCNKHWKECPGVPYDFEWDKE